MNFLTMALDVAIDWQKQHKVVMAVNMHTCVVCNCSCLYSTDQCNMHSTFLPPNQDPSSTCDQRLERPSLKLIYSLNPYFSVLWYVAFLYIVQ